MCFKKSEFPFITLCLLGFILLTSCASTPPSQREIVPGPPVSETESSSQIKAMNARLLMNLLSAKESSNHDYKIGPEDLIEVVVFEEEKLNKTVRVSSQGNINLPLVGIVKAKGLTSSELEKEIRDLLTSTYMYDPHVTVFIKEYHNQRISLMGAVQKPGVYDVPGQKTVLDVLTMAGGLRDDAGKLLFLIRPPTREGDNPKGAKRAEERQPEMFTANIEELLIKGDLRFNFLLSHGDVINIPPAGKVYIGGFVGKPGGIPLSRDMTLSQAIAVAGGCEPKSASTETRIFRYTGKGSEKEILTFNVDAIHKGQQPDPYLKDNDIVFVPRSGSRTVLIEIWDFFKSHIPGFPVW